MSLLELGMEKGHVERDEENDIYVIHPRMISVPYVLTRIVEELNEMGYSVRRDTMNGNFVLVADRAKTPQLWVKPANDVPDVGETVEIIDDYGYQRKAVFVVSKYGDRFFDCGELYIDLENVVLWRKV